MNKENKLRIIENLVEYAQQEFPENISDKEKRQWIYKAEIVNAILDKYIDKMESIPIDEVWDLFLKQQVLWKNVLELIVDNIKEPFYIDYQVPAIFSWGLFAEGKFENSTIFGDDNNFEAKVMKRSTLGEGLILERKIILPMGWYYVAETLAEFNVTVLKRCGFCRKIFFNPSERKKKYCSPKCQSAAAVSRFRDKKKEENSGPTS